MSGSGYSEKATYDLTPVYSQSNGLVANPLVGDQLPVAIRRPDGQNNLLTRHKHSHDASVHDHSHNSEVENGVQNLGQQGNGPLSHEHVQNKSEKRSRFTRLLLPYTEGWPLLHSILVEKDSRRIFYFMRLVGN